MKTNSPSRCQPKTWLQVLIDTGHAQLHEKGNPEPVDDEKRERDRQPAQCQGRTVPDHLTGSGQVSERGEKGGDDAQPHRHPGHGPACHKEFLRLFLTPGEIPASDKDGRHVDEDDDQVDRVKGGCQNHEIMSLRW